MSSTFQLVEHFFRHESGQLIGYLTRKFGLDFLEDAEDAVQDTFLAAVKNWSIKGIPENPKAWLFNVARNNAIDKVRKRKSEKLISDDELVDLINFDNQIQSESEIDVLRLFVFCCHPDLPHQTQVMLILKLVCGFNINEISRAFLMNSEAVEQRIIRAKRQIKQSGIFSNQSKPISSYSDQIYQSLYMIFNEGFLVTEGESLIRSDLCLEAIRLCELLIRNNETENDSLYALISLFYFQFSRFESRISSEGFLLTIEKQNRNLWDRVLIGKGFYYLNKSMQSNGLTRYHIEAGIASCHAAAANFSETNWSQIVLYYEQLYRMVPTSVVRLNLLISKIYTVNPNNILQEFERLGDDEIMKSYHLYFCAMGFLYSKCGETKKSETSYQKALTLVKNEIEKEFIQQVLQTHKTQL